jgi:hypothetical protein
MDTYVAEIFGVPERDADAGTTISSCADCAVSGTCDLVLRSCRCGPEASARDSDAFKEAFHGLRTPPLDETVRYCVRVAALDLHHGIVAAGGDVASCDCGLVGATRWVDLAPGPEDPVRVCGWSDADPFPLAEGSQAILEDGLACRGTLTREPTGAMERCICGQSPCGP